MAKKSAEDLILEYKELFVERELNYLGKLMNEEDPDKEEEKFLKQLKSRLKFVENLNNQLTGKTGKEKTKGEQELWANIIDMKSAVGNIVTSIPKTGTEDN